jgi:hypothetical protein
MKALSLLGLVFEIAASHLRKDITNEFSLLEKPDKNIRPKLALQPHLKKESTFRNKNGNIISYHPYGQVMVNPVKIYNLYYGDFSSYSSQLTMNIVNYFAANLASTGWFQTIQSYYMQDSVTRNKMYVAGTAALLASANVRPNAAGDISEADIKAAIADFIDERQLSPDPDAVYAVIFNGALAFTAPDDTTWLGDWCGYHATYSLAGQNLKFFVVGDPSTAPGGGGGCSFMVRTLAIGR